MSPSSQNRAWSLIERGADRTLSLLAYPFQGHPWLLLRYTRDEHDQTLASRTRDEGNRAAGRRARRKRRGGSRGDGVVVPAPDLLAARLPPGPPAPAAAHPFGPACPASRRGRAAHPGQGRPRLRADDGRGGEGRGGRAGRRGRGEEGPPAQEPRGRGAAGDDAPAPVGRRPGRALLGGLVLASPGVRDEGGAAGDEAVVERQGEGARRGRRRDGRAAPFFQHFSFFFFLPF